MNFLSFACLTASVAPFCAGLPALASACVTGNSVQILIVPVLPPRPQPERPAITVAAMPPATRAVVTRFHLPIVPTIPPQMLHTRSQSHACAAHLCPRPGYVTDTQTT